MRPLHSKGACCTPAVLVPGIYAIHRNFVPCVSAELPPFEHAGKNIVSLLEHVRLDHERFACDPLHGISAAIHERTDIFDYCGVWTEFHAAGCGISVRSREVFCAAGRLENQRGLSEVPLLSTRKRHCASTRRRSARAVTVTG